MQQDFYEELKRYLRRDGSPEDRKDRMQVALWVRDALSRKGLAREWRKALMRELIEQIRRECLEGALARYGLAECTRTEESRPNILEGAKCCPYLLCRQDWCVAEASPLLAYAIACQQNDFYHITYGVRKQSERVPWPGTEVPDALGRPPAVGRTGNITDRWWTSGRFEEPWGGAWQDEFYLALADAGEDIAPLVRAHYLQPLVELVEATFERVDRYIASVRQQLAGKG